MQLSRKQRRTVRLRKYSQRTDQRRKAATCLESVASKGLHKVRCKTLRQLDSRMNASICLSPFRLLIVFFRLSPFRLLLVISSCVVGRYCCCCLYFVSLLAATHDKRMP